MPSAPVSTDNRRVCFNRGLAAAKVTAGGFSDVTLIEGDREASGHGMFVDERSVDGLMGLLLGKSLPVYLTHEGALFGDRLGSEVGLLSGFYRDGLKLKAKQFQFFDAFKKHNVEEYDKLTELAEKMPEQFGMSVVFGGRLSWVLADGSEVDAGEKPMPEGALRGIPSVRFESIESCDFVKSPAATSGLFQAAAKVDAAQQGMADTIALSAHNDALAAKDVEHKSALEALTKTHSDALAALQKEHADALSKVNDALAAKDAEIAKLTAERDEAIKFDVRKSGVAPVDAGAPAAGSAQQLPEPAASDAARWKQHAELAAKNPELAREFHAKFLRPRRK